MCESMTKSTVSSNESSVRDRSEDEAAIRAMRRSRILRTTSYSRDAC